ncbi:formylglycine-generating enzyme family protein [Myxococcota bacterium]|nr:formylglycine-generating enzyme family protein [Myxococcota bacterium]
MGCTPGAWVCDADEKPAHEVTLTRSYLLAETEVTQGQWSAVMGSNPSKFSSCGSDCPVERVSWLDAVAFANALSTKEGLDACYVISGETVGWPKGAACTGYRLPTEAEWEYAARAGEASSHADGAEMGSARWMADYAGGKTHRVGQEQANPWGLADMTGNVWEWTWDWFGPYGAGATTDPLGATTGLNRVRRGGGWTLTVDGARFAARARSDPGSKVNDIGLRLARTLP